MLVFFSAWIQKLFTSTKNDPGNSVSEEMQEEIAAIKQVIQELVLKQLDDLSTKAERCRGR